MPSFSTIPQSQTTISMWFISWLVGLWLVYKKTVMVGLCHCFTHIKFLKPIRCALDADSPGNAAPPLRDNHGTMWHRGALHGRLKAALVTWLTIYNIYIYVCIYILYILYIYYIYIIYIIYIGFLDFSQTTIFSEHKPWLVGGFNHLDKYEFVNGKDDIPYMMENKNVPNHQPVYIYRVYGYYGWWLMLNTLMSCWSYTGWWFQPLWKIWKPVGMMKFPIYGKIKFMFQTTKQYRVYGCFWEI